MSNPYLDSFMSQFFASLQASGVEESKIKEFHEILDTPTGELIARLAFYVANKT